eukprot:TRINITY_DN2584_c0_g1_i2.p2 TRINITY_DN2584_c0_g1~~TRINITY_DN2584_c0_g1_i2.p2  ORF type:complete len:113 (-),score=33.15 TRINITY_DN2584_c0_g1_i2:81-419(-)
MLLTALDAFNEEKLPVIVCGDFNDTPDSLVCTEFSKKLKSAYSNDDKHWTTWKKRDAVVKRTIDYIFYDDKKLEPTHLLSIPKDSDVPNNLPAPYYPSDHISIGAVFEEVKQ